MDVIGAIEPENEKPVNKVQKEPVKEVVQEKKESTNNDAEFPKSPAKRSSLHRFLKDQVLLMIIAAGIAYSFYSHGGRAFNHLTKYVNFTSGPKTTNAINLEAMQIIYDEIYSLRRDTTEMFEQLSEMIAKQSIQEEESEPIGIKQFEKLFRMTPIDGLEIDPKFASLFDSYDLTADPAYLETREDFIKTIQQYESEVEKSTVADTRFFVQWSAVKQDYGLFTNVPLPAGTFLGTFAGVITNHTVDLNKTWRYRGDVKDEDGKTVDLIIDGRDRGNWFYFLQIHDRGNVEAFFIPHKNMWHVGFRTSRAVRAFEELSLSQSDLE